jgi:hypothetical protein
LTGKSDYVLIIVIHAFSVESTVIMDDGDEIMRLPVILTALAISGTALFAAIPAQAAFSDCPNTSTCIWNGTNFSGTHASRAQGLGTIKPVPTDMDNKMTSWANRSVVYNSCGYDGYQGDGDAQNWALNHNDNVVNSAHSNSVSSWQTAHTC